MKLALLNAKNPAYNADYWADLWALYAGGLDWRERARNFILRNPQEPGSIYQQRLAASHYRSYLGPIVDYFASMVFTRTMEPRTEGVVDPYWSTLKEDADGVGTDLTWLMRSRVVRALVDGFSFVEVCAPDSLAVAGDRREWLDAGMGNMRLRQINRSDVFDFEVDDRGELVWALLHQETFPRETPFDTRNVALHTWRVLTRETASTYSMALPLGKEPDPEQEIPLVAMQTHGFGKVPLVSISPPDGLWMANRIESAQREHCALSNAHTWLIRRTCYALPVFKLADERKPPTMGAGYYIMIGKDEEFEWASPPGTPFDAIRAEVASQKDEIHRIVHQMAQGVENNAAAVGRSGASKQADADATCVILESLGGMVCEAVERIYSMISTARGEDLEWSVSGLEEYSLADGMTLLDAVGKAMLIDIPSPTFARELRTQAALALLHGVDQTTKEAVRDEISKNFIEETVTAPVVPEFFNPAFKPGFNGR